MNFYQERNFAVYKCPQYCPPPFLDCCENKHCLLYILFFIKSDKVQHCVCAQPEKNDDSKMNLQIFQLLSCRTLTIADICTQSCLFDVKSCSSYLFINFSFVLFLRILLINTSGYSEYTDNICTG